MTVFDLKQRRLRQPEAEAELAIVRCAMSNQAEAPDVYDRCAAIVRPEDFADVRLPPVWRAIAEVVEAGHPVDPTTVADRLRRTGELDAIGGDGFLLGLAEAWKNPVNIEHHARLVAKYSRNRRHARLAAEAHARAQAAGWDEADDALNETLDSFFDLADREDSGRLVTLRQVAKEIGDEVRAIYATGRPREVVGVPCGLAAFDAITRGFRPGHLYICGARPGMGKTAVAIAMAIGVARQSNVATLYASLEIPPKDLGTRAISSESRLNSEKVETAALSNDDVSDFTAGLRRVYELGDRVHILDKAAASTAAIRSAIRKVRRTPGGPPLGAVFVDYLQLMTPPREYNNSREREVAAIAKSLMGLAKQEDVPVIACAQLNRTCETRANKRPILADLRESGEIEQSASVVFFAYRDEFYNKETETPGIMELIFQKNRLGRMGTASMHFDRTSQRLADLELRNGYQSPR